MAADKVSRCMRNSAYGAARRIGGDEVITWTGSANAQQVPDDVPPAVRCARAGRPDLSARADLGIYQGQRFPDLFAHGNIGLGAPVEVPPLVRASASQHVHQVEESRGRSDSRVLHSFYQAPMPPPGLSPSCCRRSFTSALERNSSTSVAMAPSNSIASSLRPSSRHRCSI